MTRSFSSAYPAAAICCLTASLVHAQVPGNPTFSKHIAPIFQEKCEACHRPDSIAPMSLRTFQESRPWARAIKARVEARQMPPWHIDKTVGIQEFKNDRSLTDDQIATIAKWVDSGAPEGDPKDMPKAKSGPTDRCGPTRRCSVRRSRI
jgi:mono/diheme cytochrome c family protein